MTLRGDRTPHLSHDGCKGEDNVLKDQNSLFHNVGIGPHLSSYAIDPYGHQPFNNTRMFIKSLSQISQCAPRPDFCIPSSYHNVSHDNLNDDSHLGSSDQSVDFVSRSGMDLTLGNACLSDNSTNEAYSERNIGHVVRTRRRKAGCMDEARVCVVCGEPASGYNFDRLTCESCKAFFRRNALKPRDKIKACGRSGDCNIEGSQRKHCPSCRLEKCLAVGMKKELILPPEKLEQRAKPKRRKQHSLEDSSQSAATGGGGGRLDGGGGGGGGGGGLSSATLAQQLAAAAAATDCSGQPSPLSPARHAPSSVAAAAYLAPSDGRMLSGGSSSSVAGAVGFPSHSSSSGLQPLTAQQQAPLHRHVPASSAAPSSSSVAGAALQLGSGQHHDSSAAAAATAGSSSKPSASNSGGEGSQTPTSADQCALGLVRSHRCRFKDLPTLCTHTTCRRIYFKHQRRARLAAQQTSLAGLAPPPGAAAAACCFTTELEAPDDQLLACLSECVQRIREPFAPEERLDTEAAATLEQEYNRMDTCIRRIIRVVKVLPYFNEIGKPAQLSLLRANIYGLIVLYSSFFFERGIQKLRYPIKQSDGSLTTVTISMLDDLSTAAAGTPAMAPGLEQEQQYSSTSSNSEKPAPNSMTYFSNVNCQVPGLREDFELYKANTLAAFDHLDELASGDDTLRMVLFAIKLFDDDSLPEELRSLVVPSRRAYLVFLWTYLRWRSGPRHLRQATELFSRLLLAFVDLRTLEIRMTEFAKLLSLEGLSPLMREVCSQRPVAKV